MKKQINFDWLLNTPIAHRGLHDDSLPENSIPAYQKAIDNGFNIEIDVHLSKDKVLVVFHDDTLRRVCGIDKAVKDCTLEELKSYRLCGTDCQIPTFDEFLELVSGKVGILCEIKGTNPFDLSIVHAVEKRVKTYDGNIALQSFNPGAVISARIKNNGRPWGSLLTWQSPKNFESVSKLCDFMGKLWVTKLTKPLFYAYDVRSAQFDPKYIDKGRKKHPVIFWTVDSKEKIDFANEHGDNIIFENITPDGFKTYKK